MDNDKTNLEDYMDSFENKAVFFDKDLIIFDNIKDFNVKGKIKVDAYIISLCIKGHGILTLNDRKYDMEENDLFICRPSHILEALMMNIDFECVCICMSKDYMQNIMSQSKGSWNLRMYIENNPVLHIDKADSKLIKQYLNIIKTTISQAGRRHHKEIISALIHALSFNFSDMLEEAINLEEPTYTSSEKTFTDFFDMLTSTSSRHRSVAYYAEKLNITSKYLSAICKKMIGKPALELIAEYSIKEIENLLQRHDKTIKGIAVELGFENISYFSKYFKRYTGISPKQFREKHRKMQSHSPQSLTQ